MNKAPFAAHAKGERIATFRTETNGWSHGSVIVNCGEITYPPNDDDVYWHK